MACRGVNSQDAKMCVIPFTMGTHGVKVVVIYPRPHDEQAFESAYLEHHVPMVESKLKGLTRLVLTKVTGSPLGKSSCLSYRGSLFFFHERPPHLH